MINRLSLPELEQYIKSIDAKRYSQQRNYLGGSTNLSEYITRGFISLPRVRALLLQGNSEQDAYKLLNELAWREYWQHTWRIRKEQIFDYIRELNFQPKNGIPTAVLEAKTGITAIDEGIRQLYETGYIHNHMRMWIAGLVCNVAKCDWKVGATWMHSYLIDGDYASNHLSWQWVAGSYTGSAYLPQQDNINTYSRTLQLGSYLDNSYEFIRDMPVPSQLNIIQEYIPQHDSQQLLSTITLDELNTNETLLLYSPWTLDPLWRSDEIAQRVLIMPSDIFADHCFSQNVLDSISYFQSQIAGLKTIYLNSVQILELKAQNIYRKDYPGINDWPGSVDPVELLYPGVPPKFYPSFSSYWKQVTKLY